MIDVNGIFVDEKREMRRPGAKPVEGTGLGIYYYNARFYSPKLGRFLSPDSIVPGYANPQNLNRYSYVLNNPIRYNDPSGHSVECGLGDAYCKAGKINVTKRANDLIKNLPNRKGRNWISLSDSEKSILSEGGWDEGAFNDKGGVSDADALHDPATYIIAVVTGGGFLRAGYRGYTALVSYATINAEAPMTSIGSFGKYEKDGYTYFKLPNNIYTEFSKIGIGKYNLANLINKGVISSQIKLQKQQSSILLI